MSTSNLKQHLSKCISCKSRYKVITAFPFIANVSFNKAAKHSVCSHTMPALDINKNAIVTGIFSTCTYNFCLLVL